MRGPKAILTSGFRLLIFGMRRSLALLLFRAADDSGDIGLLVALGLLQEGVVLAGGRNFRLLAEIDDLLIFDHGVLAGLFDFFEADRLRFERHGLDLRLHLLPYLRRR